MLDKLFSISSTAGHAVLNTARVATAAGHDFCDAERGLRRRGAGLVRGCRGASRSTAQRCRCVADYRLALQRLAD